MTSKCQFDHWRGEGRYPLERQAHLVIIGTFAQVDLFSEDLFKKNILAHMFTHVNAHAFLRLSLSLLFSLETRIVSRKRGLKTALLE